LSAAISLTESQLFTALTTVLNTFGLVNGNGVALPLVRGLDNRVPEPAANDFVVMWPIRRKRLATNIDTTADNQVTGSVASNVLTVTAVLQGAVAAGQTVFGPVGGSPAANTGGVILRQLLPLQAGESLGGVGRYATTPMAAISSATIYLGINAKLQKTEVTVQVDVHGPASAENAQRISTLMRDGYGVEQFNLTGYPIAPLHADDPIEIPWSNDQQQIEERWVVQLCLQADISIAIRQQFMQTASARGISVEANAVPGPPAGIPLLDALGHPQLDALGNPIYQL
jgi:hypothetical protein